MRCPHLHVGDRALPAFHVCGIAGLVVGVGLAGVLAPRRDVALSTVLLMALAAVVTFLVLAMATKVVTGEESLTFFHHAVAALAVCAVVPLVRGEPVVAALDLAAIGLGAFLVCGRIGCLLVGCCHGRPWRRGVRYGPEHAAEGFPAYLVGVRLFPVPAVEAAGVLVAVAIASAMCLAGAPPGTVFATLVSAYAAGRFALEFARGDADRRYLFGFSEGQWTAVATSALVALASAAGIVTWHASYVAVPVGIAVAMVAVTVARRRRPVRHDRLTHPRHVRELAVAAERALELSQTGGGHPGAADLAVNHVPIGGTSLGVLVSAGVVDTDDGPAIHYAFSHRSGTLAPGSVDRVARLLLQLRHEDGMCLLVPGDHGVTHLVVAPDAGRPREADVKAL